MADKLTLGYVGIGLMGLPMTQRLAGLGWRVRAYDIVEARIAAAAASGAEAAASPADVDMCAGETMA